MEITTEKKNEGLVQLLIEMMRSCDGETINYALEQSGQAEYAFDSILRSKEELREHVGCLDNVVEMIQRLNMVDEELDGIRKWAGDNMVDLDKCGLSDAPLSTYIGNLMEIADMDEDLGNWATDYKSFDKPGRIIRFNEVEDTRLEFVVSCDSITKEFGNKLDAFGFMANINEDVHVFSRVWVKLKGIEEAIECNVRTVGVKTMLG